MAFAFSTRRKQRAGNGRAAADARRVLVTQVVGVGCVVLAALLWGLANVVVRQAEGAVAPVPLILMRFAEVALLCLPVLIRSRAPLPLVAGALGTGAIIGSATAAQAIAMTSIPVDQVAFIGALYVILTPLATSLLHHRWPGWPLSVAALVSLGGVALLLGHVSWVFRAGTWWAVAGAVGITIQLVALGRISARMPPFAVVGWQSVGASIALLAWFFVGQRSLAISSLGATLAAVPWAPGVVVGVLYLGIPAGLLALWLQARGQRSVSPAVAALALNTEPLWTALFAWFLLSETLTAIQAIGACLAVASLSVSTILPAHR